MKLRLHFAFTFVLAALTVMMLTASAWAKAKTWSFDKKKVQEFPSGWLSEHTGQGSKGNWKVVGDPTAPSRPNVLAQLSDDALNLSRSDHDMAYWVGSTYSILGDKDLAFKWLNRAVKLGNQNKPHFEKDKSLNPLRDDPRFAELMAKVYNGE